MSALLVPSHVEIPTCSRCRSEFLDGEVAAVLEVELAAAYLAELSSRVRTAIDEITKYTSQRQLEIQLGLSQGYLSRLRSGQGTPSPALVAQLASLSFDPERRLAELERFWAVSVNWSTTQKRI